MERFAGLRFFKEVLSKTKNSAQILTQTGVRTDLLVVEPRFYGSALQNLTGSRSHNARIREIAAEKGLESDLMGVRNGAGIFLPRRKSMNPWDLTTFPPSCVKTEERSKRHVVGNFPL